MKTEIALPAPTPKAGASYTITVEVKRSGSDHFEKVGETINLARVLSIEDVRIIVDQKPDPAPAPETKRRK